MDFRSQRFSEIVVAQIILCVILIAELGVNSPKRTQEQATLKVCAEQVEAKESSVSAKKKSKIRASEIKAPNTLLDCEKEQATEKAVCQGLSEESESI